MTIQLAPMIVADKHTLGGKPRVEGTRISVELVLTHLAAGWSMETLVEQYPTLTRDGILACLTYAKDVIADETLLISAA
jgi:uncharacterized protein (DUF433 family)